VAYDERDRIEALLRKIQGLEALAADRGASGPEADSTRAKAARLRAKLAMLSDAAPRPQPFAGLNQQPQPVYDHAYQPVPPSRTTMPEVCIKRIPAGYVPVRDTLEKEWFLVPRAKHSSYQAPRYTASAEELRQRLQQLPCPW